LTAKPNHAELEHLRKATPYHPTNVFRQGNTLIKETGAWAPYVHTLLHHLENEGFTAAPRVIGSGFDEQGRETVSFIEGNFIDPGPWSLDACYEIGIMLRNLHRATATFQAPANAIWRDWFGRKLGKPTSFGHCDVASWNLIERNNLPFALIDWEYAGPVDPIIELAQACWLNAKLHDDLVAEIEGLPPLKTRVQQLRAIVDGYELPQKQRAGFVNLMIEFAIFATANEANEAKLRIDTPLDAIDEQVPWAMAWRARAASWMLKNRLVLQNSLE
jgi:hypothetical protein